MLSQLFFSLIAAGIGLIPALRAVPAAANTAPQISAPVIHENIAVYFVHGASVAGPVPATLQEALAKGSVEVFETGNVQELQIENTGEEPVFVQFGDLVKGGRQDRVLTVSLVLPPKSGRVPIGSYCVEQGRWSARGVEDAKKFSMSEMLMPSREAKVAMAKRAVKPASPAAGAMLVERQRNAAAHQRGPQQSAQRTIEGMGGAANSQGEVWRSVGEVQNKLAARLAASVTSEKSRTSLQLALENDKLKEAIAAYVGMLEPAGLQSDDIVGVAIAINGRISSADVYPSNGLFRKMWPKLVQAGVTEALASAGAEKAQAPASDAVNAFLLEAENGKQSEMELGAHAKLDTRDADKALRVEAKSATGAFVHRNYLAK